MKKTRSKKSRDTVPLKKDVKGQAKVLYQNTVELALDNTIESRSLKLTADSCSKVKIIFERQLLMSIVERMFKKFNSEKQRFPQI
jgi:hypothetical protein